jgi:hypothetical protein
VRNQYAIVNIGHPDIRPISELADFICHQLGASQSLINRVSFPDKMTAVKNPTLSRQAELLKCPPLVGFEEGVIKVCCRIKERIEER